MPRKILLAACLWGLACMAAAEDDPRIAELRNRRKEVAGSDAPALFHLSEWCAEQGLAVDRVLLLAEVLQADPDHEAARRLLGFTRHEGRWLTDDEIQEAGGMVRYGGSWLSPRDAKNREDANERSRRTQIENWLKDLADPDVYKHNPAQVYLASRMSAADLPQVLPALRHTSPVVRKNAVILLGKTHFPKALPHLIKAATKDADEEVRRTAMLRLGDYPGPQAAPTLLEALSASDRHLRDRALRALERTAFRNFSVDPGEDPGTQKAAIDECRDWWKAHRRESWTVWAAAGLDSDVPDHRKYALEVLSRNPDPQTLDAVLTALEDEELTVRVQALRALAAFTQSDPEPLEEAALNGHHDEQCAALRSLRERLLEKNPERLASTCRTVLQKKGLHVYPRTDALDILYELDDPGALPMYQAHLLLGGWWPAANRCIDGLVRTQDPAVLATIRTAEHSRDLEVRQKVLWAYEELGHGMLGDAMVPFLDDESDAVRHDAAIRLGRIGHRPAVPKLLERLDDEKETVRREAWTALRAISGKNFPFHYADADAKDRPGDIRRWKQWWQKQD